MKQHCNSSIEYRQCLSLTAFQKWMISLFLIIPAILPYLAHFFTYKYGRVPTGFLQPDMPQYMAYARKLFDNGGFHLFYGNPFDPSIDTPHIYFQIQTCILGIIWYLSGWDPGIVFVLFGLAAAIFCSRAAIALYEEVVGIDSWAKLLVLVIFFWGGGLLVFSGVSASLLETGTIRNVFRFDPGSGWWFLNFGRNLIFPTEAFYHGLFLGSIYYILKKQYIKSALLAFALSFAHHFSSSELLSILLIWTILERYFVNKSNIPQYFQILLFIILFLFLSYHFFLYQFPEHKIIAEQAKLNWTYKAVNFIPAYFLVFIFALWNIKNTGFHAFFSQQHNRLLMVWFFTAFILANHEFAFRPIQPVHFTRGYVWIPLFFLGSGSLVRLFETLQLQAKTCRVVSIILIFGVFCMDNAVWLSHFFFIDNKQKVGVTLNKPQRALLDFMATIQDPKTLVLSESDSTGYLTTVYTSFRSWQSHSFTTPGYYNRKKELENLFKNGLFISEWKNKSLLIIMYRNIHATERPIWMTERNGVLAFQNAYYRCYRIKP